MKRICAWCRKELRGHVPGEGVTSTICPDCVSNLTFQRGVEIEVFLDSLPVPILVVNDGRVLSANRVARNMLGKEAGEIAGKLGGEVFECAYARLPEGCGHTIHCSGCAIRQTVMKTMTTGESLSRVPALLNHFTPESNAHVSLFISTWKMGEFVYLRIEEARKGASCMAEKNVV